MAVTVDQSSVQIDIFKPEQVFPDVQIVWNGAGQPGATFFLQDPAASEHGIRVKGDVKFLLDPGDTLADWKLGFVQIVRMTAFRVRYTGRIFSEGSIVVDLFVPGGLSSNTLLDCWDDTTIPWAMFVPNKATEFHGSLAHSRTQDNPNQAVPAVMENQRTSKVKNFLHDFNWKCEFWTILAAKSPANSLQFLGHMHWQFVHQVDFFWRLGGPQPSVRSTFRILDKFVAGAPQDASLQSILNNPVGPIANDIFKKAINSAFNRQNIRTCVDSERGLSPIRSDFWDVPADVA
jgi:hypothetical protein